VTEGEAAAEATGGASLAARPPAQASLRVWLRAAARRARPYLPALIASGLVGAWAVKAILFTAGHPALPLDDAFIHLQYARRLAEGGFFSYVAGEGYTSGATSLLWPLAIAPFYLLGLRDLSIVYVLWIFGWLAHAALCVETARIARRLAGASAALGAGAMCQAFGAFAWFAWSGMETVPFAWALMRTARVAAELSDRHHEPPAGRPSAAQLAVLGIAAPLIRPEGVIASAIAAAALLAAAMHRQTFRQARGRLLFALVPLSGPLVVPLLHLSLAGHASSSTAMVKWLLVNPTYRPEQASSAVLAHLHLLVTSVLDGGDWTAVFLPAGGAILLAFSAAALVHVAIRRRAPFHAVFVLVIALGTLLPCTYLSFLWNRVRYVWPFAGAWFVMLACLAQAVADLARRYARTAAFTGPVVAGMFAGAMAMRLDWSIRDLAQSASAIDRQQVTLGRWAAEHLPQDARIGVNDTGAIAYFSNRPTFDVVGLTTEGEARYWVSGPGSRYEHYEKLPRERLPTHFIVYPEWMSCPPVLGEELFRATVTDQSILGGSTMIVYEASYDTLGSGNLPVSAKVRGRLVDEIDIADLESEAAHGVDARGAWDHDNHAILEDAPAAEEPSTEDSTALPVNGRISDGGRFQRVADRFLADLGKGKQALLVMRVGSEEQVDLDVRLAGASPGESVAVKIPAGSWVERTVVLPAGGAPERMRIEVSARGGTFQSFHYWIYEL
jgi:hypothetical protein